MALDTAVFGRPQYRLDIASVFGNIVYFCVQFRMYIHIHITKTVIIKCRSQKRSTAICVEYLIINCHEISWTAILEYVDINFIA